MAKTLILIAVEAKLKISSSMASEVDFLQECLKQKEGNYCHNKIKVLTVTLYRGGWIIARQSGHAAFASVGE